MRHLFFCLLACFALVACGEDEPAEPTYEELLEGQEIVWAFDVGTTRPSEMKPLTCSLPSLGGAYTCYNLDGACGAGEQATVCYDRQARMVGCINSELPGEPTYYKILKTAGGKTLIHMNGSSSNLSELYVCKD